MSEPNEEYGLFSTQEEFAREFHIAEYWGLLVKRRNLILVCIGLCVAIGIVKGLLTKPTYQSSTVLNIVPDRGSLLDVNAMEQYGGYDPDFLPTQMRLIRSREIAERVARKLNLAADRSFNPALKGEAGKRQAEAEPPIGRLAGRVRGTLSTAPVRGTSLVEIACVAPTPELAADIANAVAEAYIDWTLEAKFRIVNQASQFLSGEVEQLKSELQDKERALLAYGREKDIVSVDPKQNITLQKLETLNRDYAAAVGERVSKEAKYYETRNASPDSLANSSTNGLVGQLQSEVARLERDYAEKLNLFKPEWPAMQQLKIQIDKARQHMASVVEETVAKSREAARTEYQTAQRREENLRLVMQSQKSEAMTLNTNAVEYNNLRIEVDAKRALLDSMLKKQAETEVMSRLKGERVSNIRVVDRASPSGGRSAPSYKKNIMAGLLLGAALGIALALALHYLDRALYSVDQVEQLVRVPALGVIPAVGVASPATGRRLKALGGLSEAPKSASEALIELLPHNEPRSTISEAYRSFRTALLLSRAGGIRSVVITSCFPGEGKTTTAVNLAIVLTQLGKRVLLVDADLHRPRVHQVLELPNRVGLVSILAENVEPSQAIVKTIIPGLSVVLSGPFTPNPSGLLSSDGMRKFLELAQMNFDLVVLDTPPLFPVADVLVFAQQTDGVVLCVKAGKTPREQVIRARDRISRSRASALGVLLNGLDRQAARYYGYGASYRYGYDNYAAEEEPGPRAVQSS